MEAFEAITGRRSVREFTGEPVTDRELDRLLEAARWAPSGLNNQPWRFMKLESRALLDRLSGMTKYRGVVAGAPAAIAVFLDGEATYDRTKDLMSAGAAIQNMLLAAREAGLGSCWLGEILAKRAEVEALLEAPDTCEFVALVVVGRPVSHENVGVRHPLESLLIEPPGEAT